MTFNFQFVKEHWKLTAGALLGVFVLYFLLKRASTGATASSNATDLSGGASQVQALSAAASLQNATTNGQIAVAQLNSSVAAIQVKAQLQSDLAKTSAERDVALASIGGDIAKTQITTQGGVDIAQISADAGVHTAQIESATLEDLAHTAASVKIQQNKIVQDQIQQIFQHSKHASQDYTAFAPVIALELGYPQAVPSTAAANAASRTSSSTANTIAAASSGVSTIFKGLFA